jgi:hypothetical protein
LAFGIDAQPGAGVVHDGCGPGGIELWLADFVHWCGLAKSSSTPEIDNAIIPRHGFSKLAGGIGTR